MKDTILYISDREERVVSFLKNLLPKLWEKQKRIYFGFKTLYFDNR